MKSSFKRLQEKYGQRQMDPAMAVYSCALQKMVNATGDGKSHRDDPRPMNIRLRIGEVYAVRATDNPDYYFTVTIHPNPYSGGFRKVISQFPTYGDPPPQMQVVSTDQVFKQFRQLNGEGATINFNAFPFSGVSISSQETSRLGERL